MKDQIIIVRISTTGKRMLTRAAKRRKLSLSNFIRQAVQIEALKVLDK